MENYLLKIERILDNRLEYNCDLQVIINDLKIWLDCEWLCSDMSMEVHFELLSMIPILVKNKYKTL